MIEGRATRGGRPPAGAVTVHVHELVLHGFAPAVRQRIGDAVARELELLLAEQGVPATLGKAGRAPRVDAGAFDVSADAPAETIGARVARAVFESFGR